MALDRARGQIDDVVSDAHTRGLERRAGSSVQRPEAGKKLVHAERLGDVVVRAAVEGLDLVTAVDASGQDQDRCGARRADRTHHVHALHVRQAQVEDDRVGLVVDDAHDGSCAAGRGQDLVAAGAEVDGQGPNDLRLVVDHQHAGHDADPATSERSRCPGCE